MLKHQEIIDKLTVEQKLSLLTDVERWKDPELIALGLPRLDFESLAETNAELLNGVYPSPYGAANSWSAELMSLTAKQLSLKAKEEGANVALTPCVNVKSNPYVVGLSEDPYLAGSLAGAFADGVKAAGLKPCFPECSLCKEDVEFLDNTPNKRTLFEYFLKPFELATKKHAELAITTSFSHLKGEYRDINCNEVNDFLHRGIYEKKTTKKAEKGAFVVSDGTDADLAVASLSAGNTLSIHGNVRALEIALNNYFRLKKSVEEGSISAEELDAACRHGSALDVATVDEALNTAIEFALGCFQPAESAENPTYWRKADGKQTALDLAEASVVLLKNGDGVLPLVKPKKKEKKIAVVGRIAERAGFIEPFKEAAARVGVQYYGYAAGYADDRDETLLREAATVCSGADVVLLFVGTDESYENKIARTRNTRLPIGQQALAHQLEKSGKTVVAVLCTDAQLDVGFADKFSGLLLAPRSGKYVGEALAKLVVGESNPSGKLAYTLYADGGATFTQIKGNKERGKNKIGGFLGYRRYDKGGLVDGYPFGHGLSYTKFAYSELTVGEEEISFTVKNEGKRAGVEVVQAYLGKADSALLRPIKELKRYARIELQAGESKRVNMRIPRSDLDYYDEKGVRREAENGTYEVYIGSSSADIRLKGEKRLFGDPPKKCEEKLSDYLQSESNILSGGYFMGTSQFKERKGLGRASFTAIVLALLVDIALTVWGVLAGAYKWKLNPFSTDSYLLVISIVGLFTFNVLLVFGLVGVSSGKAYKRKVAAAKEVLKKVEYENVEEREDELAFEDIFAAEFKETEEEEEIVVETVSREDTSNLVENGLTAEIAAGRLIAAAAAKGLALELKSARTLLSGLCASRLLVLRSRENALLTEFLESLSKAFGGAVHTCPANPAWESSDELLFERSESGKYHETSILHAVMEAAADKNEVKFAAITGARAADVGSWLSVFMRYFVSPERECSVSLKNKSITDKSYPVTPNLWFVLTLGEEERVEALPSYVLDSALVIDLTLDRMEEEKALPEDFKAVGYRSLLAVAKDAETNFAPDEDAWKKIDRLEAYAFEKGGYHIGNKSWQKMEKFTSVYLACGGETADGLDLVTAAKLLPCILPLIDGKIAEDENKLVVTLENFFGEENLEVTRKALELSGLPNLI